MNLALFRSSGHLIKTHSIPVDAEHVVVRGVAYGGDRFSKLFAQFNMERDQAVFRFVPVVVHAQIGGKIEGEEAAAAFKEVGGNGVRTIGKVYAGIFEQTVVSLRKISRRKVRLIALRQNSFLIDGQVYVFDSEVVKVEGILSQSSGQRIGFQ